MVSREPTASARRWLRGYRLVANVTFQGRMSPVGCLVGQGQDLAGDGLGGLGPAGGAGLRGHLGQALGVGGQATRRPLAGPRAVASPSCGPVLDDDGGAQGLDRPGLLHLVLVAVERVRHQDRRQAEGQEFGQGGGPCPGHGQVGGGVGLAHLVRVGPHDGRRPDRLAVRRGDFLVLAVARQVQDLPALGQAAGLQDADHRVVDGAGAGAGAGHKERLLRRVQAQGGDGVGPRGRKEAGADRAAGQAGPVAQGVDGLAELAEDAVGPSRPGAGWPGRPRYPG